MKKSIVLAMLGLAASVSSTFGQGLILLDNYDSSGPLIGYAGSPISNPGPGGRTWTVGLYYAVGTLVVPPDPSGIGDPSIFGGLTLTTGAGSTTGILPSNPGYFSATQYFEVPGVAGSGTTLTVELSVYDGTTYADSIFRGHSDAFQAVTGASGLGGYIGTYWLTEPGAVSGQINFQVPILLIPEPAIFAFAGLGGLALLLFRRQKA